MKKAEQVYVYDNKYNPDLHELIYELLHTEEFEKDEIIGLKIYIAYAEPIIKNGIDVEWLLEVIADRYDYRMDEEYKVLDIIKPILEKHISFKDLNEELKTVELYYPEKTYIITREDYEEAEKQYG